MRLYPTRLLPLLAVLACASPARADFENTRWGMSVAEARRACGSACTAITGRDRTELAGGGQVAALRRSTTIAGLRFNAVLVFDSERDQLQLVRLTPVPALDSKTLLETLRSRLGEPRAIIAMPDRATLTVWRVGSDEISVNTFLNVPPGIRYHAPVR